jgi:hypothetical protein
MNIPGFTATASLYKNDNYLRVLRLPGFTDPNPNPSVTPQLIRHFPVDCDFMEYYQEAGHVICICG